MKFSTIAAAATLAVSSQVFAAGGSLGDISNVAKSFGSSVGVGEFLDVWEFSVTGSGAAAGAAVSTVLDFSFLPGVEFQLNPGTQLLLATGAFDVNAIDPSTFISLDEDDSNGLQVSGPLPSAGTYKLVIKGTASGTLGGAYGGLVQTVLTPVPEPETYALMLGGLGALAFLRRRRKD